MMINMFTLAKQLIELIRRAWRTMRFVRLEDKDMAYLRELGARMTVAESLAVRMQLWKELRAVLDTYLIESTLPQRNKK